MNKPRIIFFGTPQFAVPALEKLLESDFNIAAVVTKPDTPQGRKKVLTYPPVKEYALKHNIPVLQPEKLKDESFLNELSSEQYSNIDAFVIVAYGKIIPQTILDIPKHGSINIHPSLLPKHRGPSPLQAQLLSDDDHAGVSIMRIDQEMDHGPVLWQHEYTLNNTENYESLGDQLFNIAAEKLPEVMQAYLDGSLKPQEQDHEHATICKMISKEDGHIDWTKPADYIERMTRAYHPWPGIYTEFKAKEQLTVKILKATVSDKSSSHEPGTFFAEENKLFAACGASTKVEAESADEAGSNNTVLEIIEIQPAGKSPMSAPDFIRGYIK